MNLTRLIEHPELMNKETLYELRSFVALYPYYQTARLLMLRNLYLLHDSSFDEELRRAAIYLTDRQVIFNLVEAAHFEFKAQQSDIVPKRSKEKDGNRTISLIDNFLESIPTDEKEQKEQTSKQRRKPTPADAAVDYVKYLLDCEDFEDQQQQGTTAPQLKGQDLIDTFIYKDGGRIQLKDEPEYIPQTYEPMADEVQEGEEDGIFTETLAKIYIKQGRYDKALEIIQRLYLNYPKKNAYFADQIRFLRKLIINNNINK